jgi:hypothetical protein
MPATVCSNGILILHSKCKGMNRLDDEFHKQQRQPITVFLMFHCCFRMVSSTRTKTENHTRTLRTKCSYTGVTAVVKRRMSVFGPVSDRRD